MSDMPDFEEMVAGLENHYTICPTQISGTLPDGRHVYFRFRWGLASVSIDGEEVWSKGWGDAFNGCMDDAAARKIIAAVLLMEDLGVRWTP